MTQLYNKTKTKHRTPKNGNNNKQEINNNSTTALGLERTAVEAEYPVNRGSWLSDLA